MSDTSIIQLVVTIDGLRCRARITKAGTPINISDQEVLTEGDSMNDIIDMIEAQILISQGRGNELGPDGRPVRK